MKNPGNCSDPMSEAKTYKKIATVRAVRMNEPFAVQTLEGLMKGQKGDYLCEGIDGERWPIKKEIFERTYLEVKELIDVDLPPDTD